MSEPCPPLLEVRDLHITFDRYERGLRRRVLPVVTGMDLSVRRGEIVALVGGSGAGKTLLAHAVLGILPPNAHQDGTVAVDGRLLSASERVALAGRHLALLPQAISFLDPLADVGDQIRRAAQLTRPSARLRPSSAVMRRRVDRDLVASVLRERGLPSEVARARPHELSGGQARRVLEALATLGEPGLLIADEPTPGLDEASIAAVLGRLRDHAHRGAAVVLISHDLNAAVRVADRVVVCRDGRTVDDVPASSFRGDGAELREPHTRAMWLALPVNGLVAPDAVGPPTDLDSGGDAASRGPASETAPLCAEDVWFRHRRRGPDVLRGVSISVGVGEIVGLLGPSGSGKSTLARVLAGHLRPRGGTIRGAGPDRAGDARSVQLVLQDAASSMNPRWTVARVLAEAGVDGTVSSTIRDALVRPEWLDRHPHELSGGELQRVNLARALLARPRHLIADEITANLDPITQAELWRFLLDHARAHGIGVLAISHDRPLLDVVTDRILHFTELGTT